MARSRTRTNVLRSLLLTGSLFALLPILTAIRAHDAGNSQALSGVVPSSLSQQTLANSQSESAGRVLPQSELASAANADRPRIDQSDPDYRASLKKHAEHRSSS